MRNVHGKQPQERAEAHAQNVLSMRRGRLPLLTGTDTYLHGTVVLPLGTMTRMNSELF